MSMGSELAVAEPRACFRMLCQPKLARVVPAADSRGRGQRVQGWPGLPGACRKRTLALGSAHSPAPLAAVPSKRGCHQLPHTPCPVLQAVTRLACAEGVGAWWAGPLPGEAALAPSCTPPGL